MTEADTTCNKTESSSEKSMSRPTIHFAHGNGFPSLAYQKLLNRLEMHNYEVTYIEKIGHSDDYPITENWPYLVDELLLSIEKQADAPVIAVGHSLGGLLSFMGAVKRPELFQAVIGLDALWASKMKLKMIYFAKRLGWIKRTIPAVQAKKRRDHWSSEAELKAYFDSRKFFKRFDPDCFNDYIQYGIKHDKEGYYLEFDKEKEYQIYCTLPHVFSLFKNYASKQKVPSALIYGKQSEWLKSMGLSAAEKQYKHQCFGMEGTHMFPLEHPIECADKIHEVIQLLCSPHYPVKDVL
jgi:pimeloyl-ACP methyl ester carboxylesterase